MVFIDGGEPRRVGQLKYHDLLWLQRGTLLIARYDHVDLEQRYIFLRVEPPNKFVAEAILSPGEAQIRRHRMYVRTLSCADFGMIPYSQNHWNQTNWISVAPAHEQAIYRSADLKAHLSWKQFGF